MIGRNRADISNRTPVEGNGTPPEGEWSICIGEEREGGREGETIVSAGHGGQLAGSVSGITCPTIIRGQDWEDGEGGKGPIEGTPGTATSSGRVRVYDKLMVFRGSTFFFAGRSHAKIQIVPTVPLIIYGPFRYVNISARNHSTGPRTRFLRTDHYINLNKRNAVLEDFFFFAFGKVSFSFLTKFLFLFSFH